MLQEFRAVFSKKTVAKSNRFLVEITSVPSLMQSVSGMSEAIRDIRFYAGTVALPGDAILTTENRIYGLSEKYAYGKAHDDLVITFRIDREYDVKKVMDAWIDSVYNRDTGNVFYKESYIGTIQISALTESGSSPYSVILEDAFPIAIGNIDYAWDSTNTYAMLPVTFTFKRRRASANGAAFEGVSSSTGNAFDVYGTEQVDGFARSATTRIEQAYTNGMNTYTTNILSPIDPGLINRTFNI
jgi:hypothetical protein